MRTLAATAVAIVLAAGALAEEGGLLLGPAEPAAGEAVDPGAGAAREAGPVRIIGEDESAWQLFWKGGIVMPAILVASIVALAFAIERGVALRAAVQTPQGLLDETLSRMARGGAGAAAAAVKGREGVLARVLAAALGRAGEGRAGMEEAAAAESYRALYDLRRNVRPVGIVASVAPLLGLLGTVLGMIQAFDSVSGGGLGRGEELARGIAKALLTTGAGLIVAIPALLAGQYLRWRAEDLARRAEAEAAVFIDRASAARGAKAPAAPLPAGAPAQKKELADGDES